MHRGLVRTVLLAGGTSRPLRVAAMATATGPVSPTALVGVGEAARADRSADAGPSGGFAWRPLGAPPAELRLAVTLPTGQSFRWRPTGPGQFTGVVGRRLVSLRQEPADVLYCVHSRDGVAAAEGASGAALADSSDSSLHAADLAALRAYFTLHLSLTELYTDFTRRDARFAALAAHLPGCRMLRQDPLECLFSFICSSNNNISRIGGMVDRLCAAYGEPLPSGGAPGGGYYAFPTLSQLTAAEEEQLKALGFGYRAKYVVDAAALVAAKEAAQPGWLLSLRAGPSVFTLAALQELPGVGPKVAACCALFSLDQHAVVPVDTHVWQIAREHYLQQELEGKTLTPRIMASVQAALAERFGPYAGWAHNALFIAELPQHRDGLPEELRTPPKAKAKLQAKRAKQEARAGGSAAVADAAPDGRPAAKKAKRVPAVKKEAEADA